MVMLQNTIADKYTYSLNSVSDFKAKILESSFDGMLIKINSTEFWSKLVGKFNAYNILSVYSAASILGLPKNELLKAMSSLDAVAGRFQFYKKNKITAIVDYAHTPDALRNSLVALRQHTSKRLICVFGAGGERDRGKRKIMGQVADELADLCLITDDNPRNENPKRIRDQILEGCPNGESIAGRGEAIKLGISKLKSGDLLLVAGKGHESAQEMNGQKFEFSDVEVVKNLIKNAEGLNHE